MEGLLNYAKGPLFRLTFSLMILGLARIFILDVWGAAEAYRKAGDKSIPWLDAIGKSISWLFPVKRAFNSQPFYSLASILFHIGLITVPLFLFAHVELWKKSIGLSWISLPKFWADLLTLTTVFSALAIFIGRLTFRTSRFLSRKQDYVWPLLLIVPFITGFVCANLMITPKAYQVFMLIHILSGELIFIFVPFTKIAHCVLLPFSQFILTLSWKFPARLDDEIATTLNKKGEPI